MSKRWWLVGLVIALLVAVLSPLASPHPDGLERVAEDKGFIEHAMAPVFRVIPDYAFPGVSDERLATILAGVLGTLVVFGVTYGLAGVIARRRSPA